MTDRNFAVAAKLVTENETHQKARDMLRADLIDRLLKAKTPEEREEKWRDIDALERVWRLLAIAAHEAKE